MQDTQTELPKKLAQHPVLRVVKALTLIALGVIALAFTLFFLRFAREVSQSAAAPEPQPATTSQTVTTPQTAAGTSEAPASPQTTSTPQ